MRKSGTFLLLSTDGRVLAGGSAPDDAESSSSLPFGLQGIVDFVLSEARELFTSGEADFAIDFPLIVQIFSLAYRSTPAIGMYVAPATRSTDST
jgi:hypothetical protein